MKKLLFCLLGILVIISACKKSDPDPEPQHPELIGEWKGITSQGNACEFQVINKKGILYISHYKLLVNIPGGFHSYEATNTEGIAALDNTSFKITLGSGISGESSINGNFPGSGLLVGLFSVYSPNNATELSTGTYSCSKNQ